MRKTLFALSFIISTNSFAAGYTEWAVPAQIEYVSHGILIRGTYGDPHSCGESDWVFIKPTPSNPEIFKTMTSIALTAITASRELRFFTNECVAIPMHFGPGNNVINAAADGGGFYMR